MARAILTANPRERVDRPETKGEGSTAREARVDVFSTHDVRRGCAPDDQAALRRRIGVVVRRCGAIPTAAVNTEG